MNEPRKLHDAAVRGIIRCAHCDPIPDLHAGLTSSFVGILAFVLRARSPAQHRLWLVALIVGPGGMLVAKCGASVGAPWWLYYTIPMLLTLALPLIAFRMTRRETAVYWVLAFLSAPIIHIGFSVTLGWREYMPFLPVP